jgi:mannose-6-phosphate isomerase-like protein (cupin superfamily)
MFKKSGDMITEIREQMRGGKGKVEITHIFGKDEIRGKARLCARITLQPGCSIGMHEHVDEEEIYHIIEGTGVVNDNGTEYTVSPGDSVLTGGGASHSIENTGDKPLVLMAVILLY